MTPRRTIGGSQVSAVLGLSPWSSPLDAWRDARRSDPYDVAEEGPRLRGHLLEPGLRDWYARSVGSEVVPGPTLDEPGYPVGRYGHARPDALQALGEGVGLTIEIKTSDWRRRDDWADGVPAYYLAQVLWQMAAEVPGLRITGARVVGYVVDDAPRIYTVDRDARREAALLRTVEGWYERHVLTDLPPVGTDAASRAAWAAIAPVTAVMVAPTDVDRSYVTAWRSAKIAEKQAATVRRLCEEELAARIGDARGLEGLIEWSPVSGRTTVDTKRLKRDHPEIYATLTRVGDPSRRWRDLNPHTDEGTPSEEE